MTGHVRKRGLKWAFVVELTPDAVTGKRQQKWVSGFATKRAAQMELRRRLRMIDEGDDAFPVEMTLAEYVTTKWLPHLETQGRLRASTIRGYRQLMQQHVLPGIGGMELRKVRPAHVQSVLDALTASGRAASTARHCRAAMSAAFTMATRWGLVTTNPVRASESPKRVAPQLRIPTAGELRTIIDAARGTEFEIAVLLSATTGARRGEVLGLRWGNVDLDNGRVRIAETIQRVNGAWRRQPPKTSRGLRTIPLTGETVTRLRAHRVEQAKRLLALGIRTDDETIVCDRGDGEPIDPSTYGHAAARIAKQAGVPCRLHDLRHGVATLLAAQRNPAELTSKMLGHATVGFTLSTYTHPSDDEMDGVGEVLGRALGS